MRNGAGRDGAGWCGRDGAGLAGCQLVTSAEVKRAQAKEPKSSAYTAKDNRPRSKVEVSTGTRSRESNDSHQWVGRYGPAAASCGTLSTTSLATTRIMTVAMAPMACSVMVETASPIAPSAAIAAATYKVTNSSRSRPSGSETVVPDSRVTGPTGNSAAPTTRATADTMNVAQRPNVTNRLNSPASSRARPAGTASR